MKTTTTAYVCWCPKNGSASMTDREFYQKSISVKMFASKGWALRSKGYNPLSDSHRIILASDL